MWHDARDGLPWAQSRRGTDADFFRAKKDYNAFQRVVEETLRVAPIRIGAYCWLSEHWHFLSWPEKDGDLSRFGNCGDIHLIIDVIG